MLTTGLFLKKSINPSFPYPVATLYYVAIAKAFPQQGMFWTSKNAFFAKKETLIEDACELKEALLDYHYFVLS